MMPTLFSNVLFWLFVIAFIVAWEKEKEARRRGRRPRF